MRFYLVAILSIMFAACEGWPSGTDAKDQHCRTDDECAPGEQCVDGMCEAPPDICLNGSTKHVMYIITSKCDAAEVIFFTNTVAEAEACRQKYVDIALPTEEICPLDQAPDLTNVCASSDYPPDSPLQLWNCSAAQLQTCEQNLCSNCTWTTGNCS